MTALLLALALGGGVDDAFQRANQAYFQGDFATAASGYERVLDLGVTSADLYYNLGNACLRAGRVGRAIWGYESALLLAPGDEDVVWNLAAARRQAESRWRDRIHGAVADPLWVRAVAATRGKVLATVFIVAYCGLFVALLTRKILHGFARASLIAAAGLLGAGALVSGLLLFGRAMHDRVVRRAIVLSDEVSVTEGPDEKARVSFQVHGGLEVRLVDRDASWVRVRLPNGQEGWLRDRDVGRL